MTSSFETVRDRIDRTRARAWALQVLYKWEASGGGATLRDALVDTMATRRVSPRRVPYLRRVLDAVDEHLEGIDQALNRSLENWRLDRVSAMDRAVLRIGAAELLYLDDVPPRVSLQEAVRLAEQYGGVDSPRFVNGVLDALYRRAGARKD